MFRWSDFLLHPAALYIWIVCIIILPFKSNLLAKTFPFPPFHVQHCQSLIDMFFGFCPFIDLGYINVFQVYTSDLTSLFLWTCPRCKGYTKVCSSPACGSCSTCSLVVDQLFFLHNWCRDLGLIYRDHSTCGEGWLSLVFQQCSFALLSVQCKLMFDYLLKMCRHLLELCWTLDPFLLVLTMLWWQNLHCITRSWANIYHPNQL